MFTTSGKFSNDREFIEFYNGSEDDRIVELYTTVLFFITNIQYTNQYN